MLTNEQANLRADENLLRAELTEAGARFRGRACNCPFHDDKTPSAGIYCDEGVWRFKCQGCGVGGDIFDVRAKIHNTKPEDELGMARKRTEMPRQAPPMVRVYPTVDSLIANAINATAVYRYTNPETRVCDLVVARFDEPNGKKRFLQGGPYNGGFAWKAPAGKLPLYNRIRLAGTDRVIVVEGEKCVHALQSVGIKATTAPGGAMNGGKADWSPLAGKTVYLWADNDATSEQHPEGKGVAHMLEVQKILQQLQPAPRLYWIDHASLSLPEKGDAADFVARYEDPELAKGVIEDLMADAKPVGVLADFVKHNEEMIAGKMRPLPMPYPIVSLLTRALTPKTLSCVCGDPGSGKSFWLLQSAIYAIKKGVRTCIYELEEDRNYHMQRALAIITGDSHVTDPVWCEQNGETLRRYISDCGKQLEEIGRSIWDAPEKQETLDGLREWIAERAREGFKLICVDPVTAATADEDPWVADQRFVMATKTIARQFDCCIVLVTHPKKGKKSDAGGALDDLAGGAAYQRFPQTVLWIQRNVKDSQYEIKSRKGERQMLRPSRFVRISKARNGPGAGSQIAFDFRADTLAFIELGTVIQEL